MCWNKILTALFFLSTVSAPTVFAGEHGEEPPAAEHGGGGGEHGGAAPVVEKNFSGKQTEEWLKVQAELTTLKGKVETQKTLVENLLLQRAHSGGHEAGGAHEGGHAAAAPAHEGGHEAAAPAAGHEGGDDAETLKKEHATLIILIDQFNKLNTNFQNRYPEKGANPGRIYKRINPDDLDAMENQLTAEGRLKRLDKKIKKQYQQEVKPGQALNEDGTPKKVRVVESTKNKKKITDEIPVTDQIILQK